MTLLTSQKNQIYDIIENSGLNPTQFSIIEIESEKSRNKKATILLYKETTFFYKFETESSSYQDRHYAIFCPGEEILREEQFPGDWDNQKVYFKNWLNYLNREITIIDKWDRLAKEVLQLNINPFAEENKFSIHEFEELNIKINLLKNKVKSLEITPEQLETINAKLDYLVHLARDLNKVDWKNLFIGSIISLIFQLSISQETSNQLWSAIKEVFSMYFLN